MANIHICVWQHSAWESDFKEQFIRKKLAILSSAPYVCANYDTFYTFQLCTYFLWSTVALYRNCFVELTLHQTPSFTKQTLFAIKWVFMKLTPSQSLVRWRWNGPTFPKYELCRRFGSRSVSEITHRRKDHIWPKLAKPSLESCKAMEGAVCKRTAAW